MDKSVIVFDSNISINAKHIIVALGKSSKKLLIGTILSTSDGKQWKINNNSMSFKGQQIQSIIEEKEKEGIFFYDIEGIEHISIPEVGKTLLVS